MQSFKVPVADVSVGPNASGAKNYLRGVVSFGLLFSMVGLAAWGYNKLKSQAGVGSGSGFAIQGDF